MRQRHRSRYQYSCAQIAIGRSCPANVRTPDGQISHWPRPGPVKSSKRKYSYSQSDPNQFYKRRRLIPHEGRFAIVTNVGMGCGGRGSVGRATESQGGFGCERSGARRRTALMRTAKPRGPGTRCWCQVGGGFWSPTGFRKTANSPTTVTKRIRRRGEREGNR